MLLKKKKKIGNVPANSDLNEILRTNSILTLQKKKGQNVRLLRFTFV